MALCPQFSNRVATLNAAEQGSNFTKERLLVHSNFTALLHFLQIPFRNGKSWMAPQLELQCLTESIANDKLHFE